MVKVFEFEVSNASSCPLSGDESQDWYRKAKEKLVSMEDIEDSINHFMANKTLVSINIVNVPLRNHNNGRGNTNHLIYTIVYSK